MFMNDYIERQRHKILGHQTTTQLMVNSKRNAFNKSTQTLWFMDT